MVWFFPALSQFSMFEAKVSWIFFAFLLLAVVWGFWLKKNEDPEPEREPEWVLVGDKLIDKYSKKPFEGQREMAFQQAPSMIQWSYTYVDGVRQGEALEFYPSPIRKVKLRANFVDGVRQGPVSTFHQNGTKQSDATAVDGRIVGLVTYYKTDGTVERHAVFENNFQSDTPAISATPELVKQELPDQELDTDIAPPLILDLEGKPYTGTQLGTFYGGAKAFERTYKDGQLHGQNAAWTPAGEPEYERPHHEGKKHGRWRSWIMGKLAVSDEYFQHGLQVGDSKHWHSHSEQVRVESQFVHGAEHGTRTTYDRAGNEKSQIIFDHGAQIGFKEAGSAVRQTPLPDGLTLTIDSSEEAGEHFIEFDSLPAEFEGLAEIDFRFRVSTDQADPPANANRAFRISYLHNDEVAGSYNFSGVLGGWINYKERIELKGSGAMKLQINVPAGNPVINFAGVRLRDVAEIKD